MPGYSIGRAIPMTPGASLSASAKKRALRWIATSTSSSRAIRVSVAEIAALQFVELGGIGGFAQPLVENLDRRIRSEEHTSELQSLMRISYADFCLKKKK